MTDTRCNLCGCPHPDTLGPHGCPNCHGDGLGEGRPHPMTNPTPELFNRLDAANWPGVDIARELGVPQSRVSEWRAGKHTPSEATQDKLAAMLGLRIKRGDWRLVKAL